MPSNNHKRILFFFTGQGSIFLHIFAEYDSRTAHGIVLWITWPSKLKKHAIFRRNLQFDARYGQSHVQPLHPGIFADFLAKGSWQRLPGSAGCSWLRLSGRPALQFFLTCLRLLTLQQSADRLPRALGSSREIPTPLAYCQCVLQLDLEFVMFWISSFNELIFRTFQTCWSRILLFCFTEVQIALHLWSFAFGESVWMFTWLETSRSSLGTSRKDSLKRFLLLISNENKMNLRQLTAALPSDDARRSPAAELAMVTAMQHLVFAALDPGINNRQQGCVFWLANFFNAESTYWSNQWIIKQLQYPQLNDPHFF